MEPVKQAAVYGFISKENYDRWVELTKKEYMKSYKRFFTQTLDFVKNNL